MSSRARLYYINGVIICHGKTEWCLARYITSKLHLRIRTYARDEGAHSIQITALDSVLKHYPFNNISNLAKEYEVNVVGRGTSKRLEDFKLYIIMDTDDCTESQKADFISKDMFKSHWLYEYIVPIYNSPKIEDVFAKAKITSKTVKNSEKGTFYQKIFPINSKPRSDDSLVEVQTLNDKLKPITSTNLNEFIDYCLSLL